MTEIKKKIAEKYPDINRSDYHTETEYEMVKMQSISPRLRAAATFGYQLAEDEINRLNSLINNPVLNDFVEAMKIEAAHQLERWGIENEERKPPHHYILVATKLLGKLSIAIWDRDIDKFKHHCITLAAELQNCHRQIEKEGTVINKYFHNNL